MKVYFVYATFKNIREAKKIGKLLVKNKLAACVNIFLNIFSIYILGKINYITIKNVHQSLKKRKQKY